MKTQELPKSPKRDFYAALDQPLKHAFDLVQDEEFLSSFLPQ